MPTGYTAIIDERDVTFEEFVWRCVRNFGICIGLRDQPLDVVPTRDSLLEDPAESIAYRERAAAKVRRLEGMTEAEITAEYEKYHQVNAEDRQRSTERDTRILDRYRALEEQATAWVPPTDQHERLKQFMLEQLHIGQPSTLPSWEPAKSSPQEWHATRLTTQREDLVWAIERVEAVDRRNRERLAFFDALVESVPLPKAER